MIRADDFQRGPEEVRSKPLLRNAEVFNQKPPRRLGPGAVYLVRSSSVLIRVLGIGFGVFIRPVLHNRLVVGLDLPAVQIEGFLDLVDLFLFFERDAERIHEAVEEVEQPAHHREFDDLGFREVLAYFLENVVFRARGVERNVLRPEDGRLLPRGEQSRFHVGVRADDFHLLFADSGRLTKRRVVRVSVGAPVEMARLDDHHLLDLCLEHAAPALSLERRYEGEHRLGDVGGFGQHPHRVRYAAEHGGGGLIDAGHVGIRLLGLNHLDPGHT